MYLFEDSSVDDLVLMIAAEYKGRRPEPWPENDLGHLSDYDRKIAEHARSIRTPVVGPGFCWLNMTDNLMQCRNEGYIIESTSQGFVVHLTWKGWARVDELIEQGRHIPTPDEMDQYAQEANFALRLLNDDPNVRRGEGKLTRSLLEPAVPEKPAKRIPWILRLFARTPKETA